MGDGRTDNLDGLPDHELMHALTYQREKYSDDELARMISILKERGFSEGAIQNLLDCSEAYQKKQQELGRTSNGKRAKAFEGWSNAIMSGLVAGAVFAFARSKLEGAAALIVPGLAIAFFITNRSFGFSIFQKGFAFGLMFIIGMYWKEFLDWFKGLYQ